MGARAGAEKPFRKQLPSPSKEDEVIVTLRWRAGRSVSGGRRWPYAFEARRAGRLGKQFCGAGDGENVRCWQFCGFDFQEGEESGLQTELNVS